ncbi:MAG: 3-hydroxybutyrate oligomer hydrolase family protein, partial [Gammaproteobacteria bacterium]
GSTLYDDITAMGTYAGCALKNTSLSETPLFGIEPLAAPAGVTENRCASLASHGLISGDDIEAQSADAIQALRGIGYYKEQDWGIAFHEVLNLWRSLQPTYAGSYGRFAVWENVCDVSFAATDELGFPIPVPDATLASLFATSSGIPPTSGINLIADRAVEGSILEVLATSPSTCKQDLDLDGALCFRYLSTGDEGLLGGAITNQDRKNRRRVAEGTKEVRTTANLHGKPVIIAYGREDALVFPNSQSRAYYGFNQVVEGGNSGLRIWEITPAQHFDAFLSSLLLKPRTGETLFVPLHFYLTEGLRMMLNHLMNGDPLPPSQVVRAEPRGLTPYTADDVDNRLPLPDLTPGTDSITFDSENKVVFIPRDPL